MLPVEKAATAVPAATAGIKAGPLDARQGMGRVLTQQARRLHGPGPVVLLSPCAVRCRF